MTSDETQIQIFANWPKALTSKETVGLPLQASETLGCLSL